MPYSSNKDVPKQQNTKTDEQKRAFRKAFNSALESGKSEEVAFKVANNAATQAGKDKK